MYHVGCVLVVVVSGTLLIHSLNNIPSKNDVILDSELLVVVLVDVPRQVYLLSCTTLSYPSHLLQYTAWCLA